MYLIYKLSEVVIALSVNNDNFDIPFRVHILTSLAADSQSPFRDHAVVPRGGFTDIRIYRERKEEREREREREREHAGMGD